MRASVSLILLAFLAIAPLAQAHGTVPWDDFFPNSPLVNGGKSCAGAGSVATSLNEFIEGERLVVSVGRTRPAVTRTLEVHFTTDSGLISESTLQFKITFNAFTDSTVTDAAAGTNPEILDQDVILSNVSITHGWANVAFTTAGDGDEVFVKCPPIDGDDRWSCDNFHSPTVASTSCRGLPLTGASASFRHDLHNNQDGPPEYIFGTIYDAPAVPGTPILTCVASGRDALLTWTTPASTPALQGYNITKNPSGEVTHLGLVNAYTWVNSLRTANRTFTLNAWNAEGNSATAECSLGLSPATLAGSNGIVYGGDRAELATALRVSPGALDVLMASLIIVIMLTAGAFIAGSNGAIVGGILGIGIDTMLSLIPIWLIALILAVVGAIFLLTRGGTTR